MKASEVPMPIRGQDGSLVGGGIEAIRDQYEGLLKGDGGGGWAGEAVKNLGGEAIRLRVVLNDLGEKLSRYAPCPDKTNGAACRHWPNCDAIRAMALDCVKALEGRTP